MPGVFSAIRTRARGVFFGWWIVVSASVIQALKEGLLGQGFTIYFLPLQAEFGWSRTLLAAGSSMTYVESGLLGPLEGWLADRFGPRLVVTIGVTLLGAGLIFLSTIQSVFTFFAAFVVISGGTSLCGFLPFSVAVLNWFRRKRSLALGIFMAGAGIGGVIVPAVAWSVTTQGWRVTSLASGFVVWLIGIPMALLLRSKPERYGYLPDGDRAPSSEWRLQKHAAAHPGQQAETQEDGSFGTVEALSTRAFWFIALGHTSAVLTVSAVSLFLAPHLVQQLGLSLESAGSIVAFLMAVTIVGRVVGGLLADRVNMRAMLAVSMLFHGVAILILAYANNIAQVLLFALLHGTAWGARGPAQNSIRAEYFGRKSIGLILGIAAMVVNVGQITSRIFAGWLADMRGDYRLAFTILAVFTTVGSLFFVFAVKPVRKPHPASERAVVR